MLRMLTEHRKEIDIMNIQTATHGGVVMLNLTGKLDACSDVKFQATIKRLVEKNFNRIFIEMSALTFLDSTGLGACMKAHRAVHENGGALIFISPSNPVQKVFRVTGADKIFNISASKIDAFMMIRKGEKSWLPN